VFDIKNSNITSSHKFLESYYTIYDIIAIHDSNYLLATSKGLLHTTKDQLINHYLKGELVMSLSDITESIYLVGLYKHLIVWDQKTDQ
jgi:hypothetical protein